MAPGYGVPDESSTNGSIGGIPRGQQEGRAAARKEKRGASVGDGAPLLEAVSGGPECPPRVHSDVRPAINLSEGA
jgi:hypothetical protein